MKTAAITIGLYFTFLPCKS